MKLLSDVGVESLMLTSVMENSGFGCVGSMRGLEFLNTDPNLAQLFVQYCNGKIFLMYSGFGCMGSTRGLEFLNTDPNLAQLFVQYYNGKVYVFSMTR